MEAEGTGQGMPARPRRIKASPGRGHDGDDGDGDNDGTAREPRLYFAYGSNLSPTQMRKRCPSSQAVGLGVLRGWRWLINERGFANIVPAGVVLPPSPIKSVLERVMRKAGGEEKTKDEEGDEKEDEEEEDDPKKELVYGVLYRVPADDEPTLDVCEGVPFAYEKFEIEVEVVVPPPPLTHQQRPSSAAGGQWSSSSSTTNGSADDYTTTTSTTAITTPGSSFYQQPSSARSPFLSVATAMSWASWGRQAVVADALVYIDRRRITPSEPRAEYVARMNRGIDEAQRRFGLDEDYVARVVRPFIPARGA